MRYSFPALKGEACRARVSGYSFKLAHPVFSRYFLALFDRSARTFPFSRQEKLHLANRVWIAPESVISPRLKPGLLSLPRHPTD
jgi:hypothetical protein